MPRPTKIARKALESEQICHFWRVPQEVLDMIYEYAYATGQYHPIVDKTQHKSSERDRQRRERHSYIARPFPDAKVNDFIISKDFFYGAAKAWFAGNPIFTERVGGDYSLLSSGLVYEFCTLIDLRTSIHGTLDFSACKRLQQVKFELSAHYFSELEPAKYVQEDELDETDFEKLLVVQELKKLRGLKLLEITPTDIHLHYDMSDNDFTEDQDRIWVDNVQALQDYLWTFVSQPKAIAEEDECSVTLGRVRPLYEGSRVRHRSSKLLPEDFYEWRSGRMSKFVVAARYRLDKNGKLKAWPDAPPTTWAELERRTNYKPQQVWMMIERNRAARNSIARRLHDD